MSPYKTRLPVVFLKPAEVCFTEEQALVMTVLGSCISVTMFNRRLPFAGMCHVLMPNCRHDEACRGYCHEAFRYTDCAIKQMAEKFESLGIKRNEIVLKVFGGADIMAGHDKGRRTLSVGRQNIDSARKTLLNERLRVSASHVGGAFGRKVLFFTQTGEVLMKRIKRSELPREEL